jgi:putative ABC transport system substrate-binding protein
MQASLFTGALLKMRVIALGVRRRGAGRSAIAFPRALASAVVLAAALTACGSSSNEKSSGQTVRRVGLMHVGTDHIPPSRDSLEARLRTLGWTQGRNIKLIWRNLEPDAATAQANKFAHDHVDLIVAFEDQSIQAAQLATAKDHIPVVFLHPSDPVRDGLVQSLAHPGGNLTGVFGARDVVAKQLELYQLLVPKLHRLLTLADPNDPATNRLLGQYLAAASLPPSSLKLAIRNASTATDLKRIFRSLRPGDVDGVFLLSPRLRLNFTALTIRLAERAHLPVQAHRKDWVERGALFSYGADLGPIGRAGARYVDSILRGMAPGDLPVEEVPTVEFAINLATASKLGIKVPQDMIIRADKVYRR